MRDDKNRLIISGIIQKRSKGIQGIGITRIAAHGAKAVNDIVIPLFADFIDFKLSLRFSRRIPP